MPDTYPVPSAKADNLAVAVIAASHIPLLLIDEALAVVAASRSFGTAFGLAEAAIVGQKLSALGSGEWGSRKLRSLLEATLSGSAAIEAYEMDLIRTGQPDRLIALNAQLLDYTGGGDVRLLLAITDLTEARIAERREKQRRDEKDIQLQELQHRVANSLQIIASVLMQSARRVQSEETRGHLRDAHNRVLSVAALQSHLATSGGGQVKVATYLGDLCRSITASMIPDPEHLSLTVEADDGMMAAEESMSLGLIVTELVINALKHGFPNQSGGAIIVGYTSKDKGSEWVLSVHDNGVGMPATTKKSAPGLGTTIVDALATKLGAQVTFTAANPGTVVSVSKEQAA